MQKMSRSSRQGAADSVDLTNYSFLFNGDRIVPTKTPEDLYMVTDDVIYTEGPFANDHQVGFSPSVSAIFKRKCRNCPFFRAFC